MDAKKKLFVSKVPSDEDLDIIKELIKTNDIKKYLSDSFIYIDMDEEDAIQVLRFKDTEVFRVMKEYYLLPKQAVQFIYHEIEIEQMIKELQYWSSIGDYKKYIPVIAEATMRSGMEKVYADFAIYAKDTVEAGITLNDMHFDEYLYLEDVDEEEKTDNTE